MAMVALNSLTDYNNGELIHQWFDLEDYSDHEEYLEAVHEWLQSITKERQDGELREEWCIGDVEDIPSQYVGSYDIDPEFWEYLEACNEHGPEIVQAALDCDIPLDKIEDAYAGQADSDVEFTEEWVESTGMLDNVPDSLRFYFDMEAFARDLMMDYYSSNGHYFYANW